MSETVQTFHAKPTAEQLADELIAGRPKRNRDPWKKSAYTALRSRRAFIHRKYEGNEYQLVCGVLTRKLSDRELARFRAYVDLCMDGLPKPIRLQVSR